MNLYNHQKKVIEENPLKKLIAFGCGGGKTRTVLELSEGKILVIAPKTQVLDKTWEREAKKMGRDFDMTVISKEQFKKKWSDVQGGITVTKEWFGNSQNITVPIDLVADTLIIDESHFAVGVTPATRYRKKVEIPKASQIFEMLETYIKTVRPKRLYLASATPMPQPMALYAIARLFGHEWDYFKFRRAFYTYIPKIGRGVWIPKKDKATEEKLLTYAKKFGAFGKLEDFFDVPEQTHKDITVGLSPEQKKYMKQLPLLYPDPLVRVGKRHQLEQGFFEGTMVPENKTDEIVSLCNEFKKVLIFARYTAHVDHIYDTLKKRWPRRSIFKLTGATDDRRQLLSDAELFDDSIVVAQSQISTGYELPSFRCTIFASQSYSFVDYEQALGRTLRANHLAKNVYVTLVSDEIDKQVLKNVRAKQDFNEKLFANEMENS